MLMLVVKGYKVERDLEEFPAKDGEFGANNVYIYGSGRPGDSNIEATIKAAVESQGLTEADIISITMVPWQVNGRDRGSNDYHIFLRG
ncbi:hypothetical protein Peetri_00232 [Pseudomonas phage vB_PpuM-Peetri]